MVRKHRGQPSLGGKLDTVVSTSPLTCVTAFRLAISRGRLPSLPLPPPNYDVTAFSPIHKDFPQVDTGSVLLVTNEESQVGFYFSKSLLQAASRVLLHPACV